MKELLDELRQARGDMTRVRIAVKTKHEKDSSKVLKQKKYIARLLGMIREVELEEAVESANKID